MWSKRFETPQPRPIFLSPKFLFADDLKTKKAPPKRKDHEHIIEKYKRLADRLREEARAEAEHKSSITAATAKPAPKFNQYSRAKFCDNVYSGPANKSELFSKKEVCRVNQFILFVYAKTDINLKTVSRMI